MRAQLLVLFGLDVAYGSSCSDAPQRCLGGLETWAAEPAEEAGLVQLKQTRNNVHGGSRRELAEQWQNVKHIADILRAAEANVTSANAQPAAAARGKAPRQDNVTSDGNKSAGAAEDKASIADTVKALESEMNATTAETQPATDYSPFGAVKPAAAASSADSVVDAVEDAEQTKVGEAANTTTEPPKVNVTATTAKQVAGPMDKATNSEPSADGQQSKTLTDVLKAVADTMTSTSAKPAETLGTTTTDTTSHEKAAHHLNGTGGASETVKAGDLHMGSATAAPAPPPAPPAMSAFNRTLKSSRDRAKTYLSSPIPPESSGVAQINTRTVPVASYNQTEKEPGIMVHAINGAKPLPALGRDDLVGDLKDCVLSAWSAWGDCIRSEALIYKGESTTRTRRVIQPQIRGGKPCGLLSETTECGPM